MDNSSSYLRIKCRNITAQRLDRAIYNLKRCGFFKFEFQNNRSVENGKCRNYRQCG
jgi:hypothetical protein